MTGKAFSGKQKKEQLQQKRQAKREKQQSAADADKCRSSSPSSSNASDEEESHHRTSASSSSHHRQRDAPSRMMDALTASRPSLPSSSSSPSQPQHSRASDKPSHQPNNNKKNKQTPPTASKAHGTQRNRNLSSDGSEQEEENDELLTYGKDKQGVRSVFQKESNAEVEARKQRSYAPLRKRDLNPAIPYGSYFVCHEELADPRSTKTLPLTIALPTRTRFVKDLDTVLSSTTISTSNPTAGSSSSGHESHNSAGAKAAATSARNDIEAEENVLFQRWMERIDASYFVASSSASSSSTVLRLPESLRKLEVNSYERNLDVWRQLWRTVEGADVVVVVVDCRYPIVHLPASLVHFITVVNRKKLVVCMNKADLVPPSVVQSWIDFFGSYFSLLGLSQDAIRFVPFTTLPEAETAFASENLNASKRRKAKHRNAKLYEEMKQGSAHGASHKTKNLLPTVEDSDEDESDGEDARRPAQKQRDGSSEEEESADSDHYGSHVNFKGMNKSEKQLQHGQRSHKELEAVRGMINALLAACREVVGAPPPVLPSHHMDSSQHQHHHHVTIGVVGHPNVGKSSLINAIRGSKVVSVSSTAGHTKHMQTIPMPEDGVTLLDCPGLAFPVLGLPRPLQAVIGTHQIAQTRDPISGVAYLATRLPLESLYGLRRMEYSDAQDPWSPYELCESYGTKKGFRVKRGKGLVDIHRSAIAILQEAYEGRLVLYFMPPALSLLQSSTFLEELKPHLVLFPVALQQ